MKVTQPGYQILACNIINDLPYDYWDYKKLIEVAGRTCYKSEDKITPDSSEKFFNMLQKKGHYAMLEHSWFVKEIPSTINGNTIWNLIWSKNHPYIYAKSINGKHIVAGNFRALTDFQDKIGDSLLMFDDYIPPVWEIFKYPQLGCMTVKFIYDRGVSHEKVRHRPPSFAQESTRWCNYAKSDEIQVINPYKFDPLDETKDIGVPFFLRHENRTDEGRNYTLNTTTHTWKMNSFDVWFISCLFAEWAYMTLINKFNQSPQWARSVLPTSTKTEIVVTADLREWHHIFSLRTAPDAHPQMREVMVPLLNECKKLIPIIFDDITHDKTV